MVDLIPNTSALLLNVNELNARIKHTTLRSELDIERKIIGH